MAVEIPNPHAMVSFIAANPPVILSRAGVRGVTRSNAGVFQIELEEKIPLDANTPANSLGAGFSTTINGPFNTGTVPSASQPGDVAVSTYNQSDAVADVNARVDLIVWRYPTQS
jgi:hypothetical protein